MNRITDQELEVLQKKANRGAKMVVVTAVLVFFIILGLILWGWFSVNDGLGDKKEFLESIIPYILCSGAVAIGGGFLAYLIFMKNPYERFNCAFKDSYILSTIQSTNRYQNLSYSKFKGFSYDDIRNGAVINCGDRKYFSSEDMLTGQYRNVQFCFSDVKTQKIVIRNNKGDIETIFQGQVIRLDRFDHRKVSDGYLQIFQKKFLFDIQGWTGQHKIEMEDMVFNQKFQVYAEDEHNAFYILTPQMLEKITEFSQSVGEQVAISFYGETMFVAINGWGSAFDAKIDVPIAEQKEQILKDVQVIEKAVDILLNIPVVNR